MIYFYMEIPDCIFAEDNQNFENNESHRIPVFKVFSEDSEHARL